MAHLLHVGCILSGVAEQLAAGHASTRFLQPSEERSRLLASRSAGVERARMYIVTMITRCTAAISSLLELAADVNTLCWDTPLRARCDAGHLLASQQPSQTSQPVQNNTVQ